ncbi:MAG: ATP-binding cassette domain-containing protein [Saprospiraceae bacterium]
MLKTQNLQYTYKGGTTIQLPDFECKRGEHWLVLGQSGSGKTTLLHLLAGLLKPGQGSIRVGAQEITQLSGAQMDQFRGKHIGIVFQKPNFVAALTVEENLALAQNLAGNPANHQQIRDLLSRLGIENKRKKHTHQLSQGEQQRVAIARAIINQPEVILADEPTSALDDKHTEEVVKLLIEQANAVNANLLIVTHDGRLKGGLSGRLSRQAR